MLKGKNQIKVAVIGGGRAGLIHAGNLAFSIPEAKLVAMVEPDDEKAAAAAQQFEVNTYQNHRELLENESLDAAVVVTPTWFHRDIVLDCAHNGVHILCEKPMAITETECRDMLQAVEDHGVKLQIGFMRRFDQSFLAARQAVDEGHIGNVVLVKSLTRGPSIPQPWQYDIQASNGPLAEVNSHDIDTLRWMAGAEISEVYAVAGNFRCPEAATEFPDFYDNVIMTCRFNNGCQGHIDGAVSVKYGYDARVEIVGTEGVIFIGRTQEYDMVVVNGVKGVVTPFQKSWRTLFTEAYQAEDQAFIDCILLDTSPQVSGRDGLEAVRVVNAGNQSIAERKPISITHNP